MNKSSHHELYEQEILTSSNCEYILVHYPSSILSFYSLPQNSVIQQWTINNNTIWSIHDFQTADYLIISNNGCLSFLDNYNITTHQICDDFEAHLSNPSLNNLIDNLVINNVFGFELSSTIDNPESLTIDNLSYSLPADGNEKAVPFENFMIYFSIAFFISCALYALLCLLGNILCNNDKVKMTDVVTTLAEKVYYFISCTYVIHL